MPPGTEDRPAGDGGMTTLLVTERPDTPVKATGSAEG
jgi:hypothetical protein